MSRNTSGRWDTPEVPICASPAIFGSGFSSARSAFRAGGHDPVRREDLRAEPLAWDTGSHCEGPAPFAELGRLPFLDMSQAVAIIVAAIIGAVLAVGGSITVVELQARRQHRHDRQAACRKAYSDLLATSTNLLQYAQMLHVTMATRSGLTEGVDVLSKVRKPIDPLELWETMRLEVDPLNRAWAEVWTVGSQDGIHLANILVDRCAVAISLATARGEGRSPIMRVIAGEKWTSEQLDSWAEQQRTVAAARRELALFARSELGYEVAEVFTAPTVG
jgi:hypothetical protein